MIENIITNGQYKNLTFEEKCDLLTNLKQTGKIKNEYLPKFSGLIGELFKYRNQNSPILNNIFLKWFSSIEEVIVKEE